MFKPLALYIGLRYTRAKRRNHFISFISLVSMLGIALGVTVLITVLSVMNGFDKEIRERILGFTPHITVTGYGGSIHQYEPLLDNLRQAPDVLGAVPYVEGQGLLTGSTSGFALFQGVSPDLQSGSTLLTEHVVQGDLFDLQPGAYNIILGLRLAQRIGATVGDSVTLVLPEAAITPAGVLPRIKRFKVSGIFEVAQEFDNALAYVHMQDAQTLLRMDPNEVSGINLTIENIYAAPRIASQIFTYLNSQYLVYDWTTRNSTYFDAIKLEKTLIFILLLFIVAVAAFNILSGLVMVVTDKQADIAILRTLGASPGMIMRIFFVQGTAIGIIGTLLGLIGGISLASNVTTLVAHLESALHTQLISADIYFLNYLPSDIQLGDVVTITLCSLGLSLLATLYPAGKAAFVKPAEALRYE